MTQTTPAVPSQFPKIPKYHAGDDICRQMMINLTANNRDPAAIEAKIAAREAAARPFETDPVAPSVAE